MPTVFASVSVTILFFYALTLLMAHLHLFPVGLHMLWGFFITILVVLLQCLIFGFFIGSGKSIKKTVKENNLAEGWIERTVTYKNKCYPPLMLAIAVTTAAGVVGGGVSTQSLPVWIHELLAWGALLANAWSLRISHKTITENVRTIHAINAEIRGIKEKNVPLTPPAVEPSLSTTGFQPPAGNSSKFYFLALALWVPYLYVKFSLGSRTFPFWPFLVLSCLFLFWGSLTRGKNAKSLPRS